MRTSEQVLVASAQLVESFAFDTDG